MAFKPDWKKYRQSFLKLEDISKMGSDVAGLGSGLLKIIVLGIRIVVLAVLYWMWRSLRADQLREDKQTYESQAGDQDNHDVNN